MKTMDNYFEQIREILFQCAPSGKETLSTGAVLIGQVPHVAPEAWFHALFPPLSNEEVTSLEKEIIFQIPDSYKFFLLNYGNGISIFNNSFNLYGLRKILGRGTEAVWQPFSLITPNTIERPDNAKVDYLIIGGYNWNGSKVYVDTNTNKVYHCAKKDMTPLYEWKSIEDMLICEVKRMSALFDNLGKVIDKKIPTVPVL